MSDQPDISGASPDGRQAGELRLDLCGRQVLGFVVAAVLPGYLFGLALGVAGSISSGALHLGLLVVLPLWAAVLGLIVTVPTAVFVGIPTYWLFIRLGWTDWPRCVLGGALIGWIVGLLVFGGGWTSDPAQLLDPGSWREILSVRLNLGSALLGAASVLMLWSIVYTRRARLIFVGILSACPLVTWCLP